MNNTLNQLESLFENGIISKDEYKTMKNSYVLCKTTVMEIEESTKHHYESMLLEKIAKEESEKVREHVNEKMRHRKILNMYFNGFISEEEANRLLEKA